MKMRAEQIMLKLPSNPRNIAILDSIVKRAIEQYRIRPDLHCNILVSLTEAVKNATRLPSKSQMKDAALTLKMYLTQLLPKISPNVEDAAFFLSNNYLIRSYFAIMEVPWKCNLKLSDAVWKMNFCQIVWKK